MKTRVKQLAAGTFLTMLLMFGIINVKGTELKALSLKTIETSIQLENWMTDETIWKTNSFLTVEFAMETELESESEIESWMTDLDAWDFNNEIVTVPDSQLESENQMTVENMLKLKETAIEKELTLENWMVDDKVWE